MGTAASSWLQEILRWEGGIEATIQGWGRVCVFRIACRSFSDTKQFRHKVQELPLRLPLSLKGTRRGLGPSPCSLLRSEQSARTHECNLCNSVGAQMRLGARTAAHDPRRGGLARASKECPLVNLELPNCTDERCRGGSAEALTVLRRHERPSRDILCGPAVGQGYGAA